jgi:hypothetical protein
MAASGGTREAETSMSERPTSWLCPACGRQVPIYIEGCRCGVARERALPGVEVAARASDGPGPLTPIAAALVGYSPGMGWSGGRRTAAALALMAKLAITFALVYAATSGEAGAVGGEARILARLDEHTRAQATAVKDTIPTFLLRPGLLGTLPAPEATVAVALPSTPASTAVATPATEPELISLSAIKPLNETELRKGFCTPTLPSLIRQRFPGSYDAMPDAELEKRVLAKYPEYRNRICDLPAWIGAEPHEIIKYEPVATEASIMPVLPPWAMATLVTLAMALVTLNVYYRVVAPRVATS